MLTQPPFVLFALTEHSIETLDYVLQAAHDDRSVDNWWWYLPATLDYGAAPQYDPKRASSGTQTPISPSFLSLFVGKNLKDVAAWLRGKPKSVDVEDTYFGVLDKEVDISGRIAICRLNDPKIEKEEVWCLLKTAEESSLYLDGLDSDLDFNEEVAMHKYTLQL
ncbi:MAG: hypothetical protein Q9168_004533 [Polycauliona sp. 1 TL-2023]